MDGLIEQNSNAPWRGKQPKVLDPMHRLAVCHKLMVAQVDLVETTSQSLDVDEVDGIAVR